jgi:hypothetical protein
MAVMVCWGVAHAMYLVARLEAELANAGEADVRNVLFCHMVRCALLVLAWVYIYVLVCWGVAHAMHLVARLEAELANTGGVDVYRMYIRCYIVICRFVVMSVLVCWFVARAMYLVARLEAELANAGGADVRNMLFCHMVHCALLVLAGVYMSALVCWGVAHVDAPGYHSLRQS